MTKSLHALILGAAAGGGLPQWNCGCDNCRAARDPVSAVSPQTQSSLAVSADGERWAILNASPDIRTQMAANPQLHPRAARDNRAPVVMCTNGDIDHIAGLLTLREKQSFTLHATREILDVIEANSLFDALDREFVTVRQIDSGDTVELLPGLQADIFSVPGKVPLYLEGEDVDIGEEGGNTIGVTIRAHGKVLHYVPGCAHVTEALASRLQGADAVLFDGTVYTDDEMIAAGVGSKTGQRMGHIAMSGENGAIAAFRSIECGRKIFVHINNTNPVWRADSDERAAVEAAGWRIGEDSMEIRL
ncbi:pyrroloquinoline quinone biosynthesis protein PqqB [Notoacmeibacter sp. MSK16QG-6]|uniref:pyrroloquinoline quinone biosynthesis protein PqqB n=1 Tax=Notoacmeibacter sp. MSK16QG-6 TaxID=2957982 RepID=UPI0020A1278B|nr:pyrroloquinoline quinone biosynthesis protein PqqB [Notoacmeibacter sp. MSK16QG-6]MCP1200668.1 pyrroloquinoline quinone biosynthesis protein PqqB [Notoacmeibacter sp. MSK16QG-6]